MEFNNNLKGKVTQTLMETLLENANYKIVPLGIEELIREVKLLSHEQYLALKISMALRKLPDFFIANESMDKSWLVEVKYRKKWDEATKQSLLQQIEEQVKTWEPLTLVVFLGEKAKPTETPSSYLGVIQLVREGDEIGRKITRNIYDSDDPFTQKVTGTEEVFTKWGDIQWTHFKRFQDYFPKVTGDFQDSTLIKATSLLKSLYEIDTI